MDLQKLFSTFISEHKLTQEYVRSAQKWFIPLADRLVKHHNSAGKTILIGVNGCQGSGKSTLTDLLVKVLSEGFGKKTIGMSIDDFYLSKRTRQQLACDVHPLLSTRGVPGTHDTNLLKECLFNLKNKQHSLIPVFNKAEDDLLPQEDWKQINQNYDIVILEGWCVGIAAQEDSLLLEPVNTLEREHDPDSTWRNYVNAQIQEHYQPIYDMLDYLVMLKAPSFECVYNWRLEQEHKLIAKLKANKLSASSTMDDKQISRFIQFYERLTTSALALLPAKSDAIFYLSNTREVIKCDIQ